MSTNKYDKLKKVLGSIPSGTVALASWLEKQDISRDLQKRYKSSGWLLSIGAGALIKLGENVEWQGGLYAIQQHANMGIHAGGLTALSLQGQAHYLRLAEEAIYLFSQPRTILPSWFKNYNWGKSIQFYHTSFLPSKIGLIPHEEKTFSIEISSAERAILELIYLVPNKMDLVECYQILEGLTNLRPQVLQLLLESCTSVKVVRIFLYMAKKAKHRWLKYLDESKFKKGSGDRSLVKNGVYVADHKITIPKELYDL